MLRSNGAADGRVARWAIGLGAAAVLLGHGVTYALVHPDGHERAGVLASTGHAYLHLLDGPGLLLAMASLLAAASMGFGRLGRAPDRGTLFRRLATFQLAAFAAMEVAERVGSGAFDGGAGDLTLMAVGSAVQLALAGAGAWLLRAVHRGGERLSEVVGSARLPVPLRVVAGATLPDVAGVSATSLAPRPGRGPPLRRP
jgi:hypothetical protein